MLRAYNAGLYGKQSSARKGQKGDEVGKDRDKKCNSPCILIVQGL